MTRTLTSIREHCREQGTPYHEACYDETHSGIIRKCLDHVEITDIRSPYVYCGLVQDVQIFGHTFLYLKNGEYVFQCQSFQNNPELIDFEGFAKMHVDDRRAELFSEYVEEECVFIGGSWLDPADRDSPAVNFGHFVFEFLSRLAIFDLFDLTRDLPVVIYDSVPERWIGHLELAGIPRERIMRISVKRPPAFRKVWVSSCPFYRDINKRHRAWGNGFYWLKARMLKSCGGPNLEPRRRIYIGRVGAKWRRLLNEQEVMALLAEYGIEYFDGSTLDARDQLRAVAGAELIVVAAGAGGIMTSFAPEHCIVLQLCPSNIDGTWGGLAAAIFLRQVYERVVCELVETRSDVGNSEFERLGIDFRCDLSVLRNKVEMALGIIQASQVRDALKQ